MVALPAAGYFNTSITNSEAKTAQDNTLAFIRQSILGTQALSELTISSGAVTPTASCHTVDTESDAASDNLDNLVLTNMTDGQLIMLSAADGSRTVVIRDSQGGTGQFITLDSANISLDETNKFVLFQRVGNDIIEVQRSFLHPSLSSIAALTTAANKMIYTTGSNAYAVTDLTAGARALIALTGAANEIPYFTGASTAGSLSFKDEDDMVSDSATAIPSQQSVKAYVDNNASAVEEGTYTVSVTCSTSGTISLYSTADLAGYTKIGLTYHVHGRIRIQSISSPSGALRISLPAAVASLSETAGGGACVVMFEDFSSNSGSKINILNPGTSYITVYNLSGQSYAGNTANDAAADAYIHFYATFRGAS